MCIERIEHVPGYKSGTSLHVHKVIVLCRSASLHVHKEAYSFENGLGTSRYLRYII